MVQDKVNLGDRLLSKIFFKCQDLIKLHELEKVKEALKSNYKDFLDLDPSSAQIEEVKTTSNSIVLGEKDMQN